VTIRLLVRAALIEAIIALAWANGQTPLPLASPPASVAASPSSRTSLRLAPFKERLAAAKSVKVETDILGVKVDSSLDAAHAVLDSLCDSDHQPKEAAGEAERGEDEHKVFWQLAKSDFSSVLVKTDDKERITYILGTLRPGKEIPFDKIGKLEKAPILTDKVVAWDVVKPDNSLLRVVARGAERKASSITVFVVKRSPAGSR
jgi:hypothetical protein